MDSQIVENVKKKMRQAGKGKGVRQNKVYCRQCKVHAHNHIPDPNSQFIHAYFEGMTCMEILHSPTGKEIWKFGASKATVNYSHYIVDYIRRSVDEFVNKTEY